MPTHQGWFTALYTQHLLDSQSLEFEIYIFPREASPSHLLDFLFTDLLCSDSYSCMLCNRSFQLCGIALLIVGCLFRFGNDQLKEDMKPTFENINISNSSAYDLFFGLSIVFVTAGAFIIIISIFGFIGAACTADLALYIVSFDC